MTGPRTEQDLRAIRASVEWVGRMSDGLVKIGPLNLGLDGLLSWVPGLGELYSTAAGGFLLVQGWRAGVPMPTLAGALAMLSLRTVASGVPIAGAAFADVFTAHKWTARMIVRAIDKQLGEGAAAHDASGYASWRGRAAAA